MKLFPLLLVATLFCFGALPSSRAQLAGVSPMALRASTDGGIPLNEGFTLRRQVQEAQVRFVATDAAGKPVLGLHAEDIQVFDIGVPVRNLKSFALSRYQPLEVGVVVDLSESIGPQQQRQALMAADLLREIFDARQDEAFVVGFSNTARLLQAETTDIDLVRRALLNNPGRQGLTSLFDALMDTCRTEFARADNEHRQRIMLLFSDGADNLSMHGLDGAVQEALRVGVTVYAITSAEPYTRGFKNLQQLTSETGGKVYAIPKKKDLASLAAAMSESVRGEYTFTFSPAITADGFHPVRIELPTHHELTLRANSGYYVGQ